MAQVHFIQATSDALIRCCTVDISGIKTGSAVIENTVKEITCKIHSMGSLISTVESGMQLLVLLSMASST